MLDYARKGVTLAAGKTRADLDSDEVFGLAMTRLVEVIAPYMTLPNFINRIQRGSTNHLTYTSQNNTGLVSIWKHGGDIILTWEECPLGQQYDESTYTRDERHVFKTTDELMLFLSRVGLDPQSFTG